MALVPVEKLGGGCDESTDSGLPATVEPLEFKVGGHEEIDKLSVGGSSGSAAVDIGSNIVDFLAVLFDNNRAAGGSGVSSQDDPVVELASHNGGTSLLMGDGVDNFLFEEDFVSTMVKVRTSGRGKDRSLPSARCKLEGDSFLKNI